MILSNTPFSEADWVYSDITHNITILIEKS